MKRNVLWRLRKKLFAIATEHLGMKPLTGKMINNSKNSDHILLKGNDASFKDLAILLNGNNKLKLHLKEIKLN